MFRQISRHIHVDLPHDWRSPFLKMTIGDTYWFILINPWSTFAMEFQGWKQEKKGDVTLLL